MLLGGCHMPITKRISGPIGALVLALVLAACSSAPAAPAKAPAEVKAAAPPSFPADSYMAKIVSRGKLVAGVKFDTPLMGFQNPKTGEMEGFEVELVRDI